MEDDRKSTLVKYFGFPATLVHGDTLEFDRWSWLKQYLPTTRNGERLLDVGCGSGAFAIGAALRGYTVVGLSWDERNQTVAESRARLIGVKDIAFPVQDARKLDERTDFRGSFDVVICLEVTEHILDDFKLFRDLAGCLKPGGRLLVTTPNRDYKAISPTDDGPFETVETGWHVRRGYTKTMLTELCQQAALEVETIGYCSFFFSQTATKAFRTLRDRFGVAGWAAAFPLRLVPPLLDGWAGKRLSRPGFSITLVAYKPRLNRSRHPGHEDGG
ncbi:class I SAM-dependent methyltransferase [Lichenicoccus sp.]|uniref:class I SAM-dependent methyltransferase n=1 Tax=Lichenicoccus sp. TaxID=2781899 RepID=UPI003D108FB3